MHGNPGIPPHMRQPRRKKFNLNTKLCKLPFWANLIRTLSEPIEMPAYIEGNSLIIYDCWICRKPRHCHGWTGEEVGEVTPRLSHCVSAPGIPILLRVMKREKAASDA